MEGVQYALDTLLAKIFICDIDNSKKGSAPIDVCANGDTLWFIKAINLFLPV